MTLPKPYFGQDIEQLEKDCSEYLRIHEATEPREDLAAFNPAVKGYGTLWAEIVERNAGLYVIAGIVGNMSGVPIALFSRSHRDAAKRYVDDFGHGRSFTIANDERWCDYINAANEFRPMSSTDRQWLISKGRKSGMTLEGKTYSQAELQKAYESGEL